MKMLDTNMILRFLLKDNAEMSDKVNKIISNNQVIITNEVAAEVVYVLGKVYGLDRSKVSEAIFTFLRISNVIPKEPEVLKTALNTYSKHNLDFVDCILYAYRKEFGYEIYTFDKKLNFLLNT